MSFTPYNDEQMFGDPAIEAAYQRWRDTARRYIFNYDDNPDPGVMEACWEHIITVLTRSALLTADNGHQNPQLRYYNHVTSQKLVFLLDATCHYVELETLSARQDEGPDYKYNGSLGGVTALLIRFLDMPYANLHNEDARDFAQWVHDSTIGIYDSEEDAFDAMLRLLGPDPFDHPVAALVLRIAQADGGDKFYERFAQLSHGAESLRYGLLPLPLAHDKEPGGDHSCAVYEFEGLG